MGQRLLEVAGATVELLHRVLTVAKFRLLVAVQLLAAMLVKLWPGARLRSVLEEMVQDVEEEEGDDSDDGRSSWPWKI